jgi:UDP-2,3-diacylglucosamine hydrolase
MCGAGPLPARMAQEARRHGWRVIAFTFAEAEGLSENVDRVIASRVAELGPVLEALQGERVSAALFAGKFWMQTLVAGDRATADLVSASFERQAQSRTDTDLSRIVVTTLAQLGISVLDQRDFLGDWLAPAGCLTGRVPSEEQWRDVRTGLLVARRVAESGIGQTVVVRHGVVTAVEAVEGTNETIRRGTRLAGPEAVVVKTVSDHHDYRFDLPVIGRETVEVAAVGGASVLAFTAGRIMLLEPQRTLERAESTGMAVVSVGGDGT